MIFLFLDACRLCALDRNLGSSGLDIPVSLLMAAELPRVPGSLRGGGKTALGTGTCVYSRAGGWKSAGRSPCFLWGA